MNESSTRRWGGIPIARIGLGFSQLLLASFAGGAFGTRMICLTVAAAAFVVVIALPSRRPSTIPESATGDAGNGPPACRRSLVWGSLLIASLLTTIGFVMMWRFFIPIGSTTNVLFLVVDTVGHLAVFLSLTVWLFWPDRGHVMLLVLGMVAVLMAVAGGAVSSTVTGQMSVALVVGVVFAAASGWIVPQSFGSSRQKLVENPSVPSGAVAGVRLASGLTLLIALMMTSVLVQVTQRVLPEVQSWVFAGLRDQLEDSRLASWASGGRYVEGDRLGQIRTLLQTDPQAVALRGYSDPIPGYLGGTVFDSYHLGRWSSQRKWRIQWPPDSGQIATYELARVDAGGPAVTRPKINDDRARQRFRLVEPTNVPLTGEFVTAIEIHGEPSKGSKVFLPPYTGWIETASQELGMTAHGVIQRGIRASRPYVTGVMEKGKPDELDDLDRQLLLSLHPDDQPFFRRLAARIVGNAVTPADKAERIAAHFQRRFTYSLEPVNVPRRVDPIVHFLQAEHPGHCELFASASTLLLRGAGVPSRYVTGYVMDEMSDESDYFLARNSDAHAWVEFYDDATRTWLPLEPTPGRVFRTPELIKTDVLASGQAFDADELDELNRGGWLAGLTSWLRTMRATETLVTFFRWSQIPLVILLVFLLWLRSRDQADDSIEAQLIRQRRRMDRWIGRFGLTRRSSETLHQFADRATRHAQRATEHGDRLRDAADWYRRHAEDLYSTTRQTSIRIP